MPLIVEQSIVIQASSERVWQVLTQSEYTRRYMFGCEAATDWRVGGPLVWQVRVQDKTTVYARGSVLAAEVGRLLSYTTLGEGMPSNEPPLRVVCRLTSEIKDRTRMEVSQGDFQGKRDAEKRYAETVEGWASVLPQIKALAESWEG